MAKPVAPLKSKQQHKKYMLLVHSIYVRVHSLLFLSHVKGFYWGFNSGGTRWNAKTQKTTSRLQKIRSGTRGEEKSQELRGTKKKRGKGHTVLVLHGK